jgi:four helix bundle protein
MSNAQESLCVTGGILPQRRPIGTLPGLQRINASQKGGSAGIIDRKLAGIVGQSPATSWQEHVRTQMGVKSYKELLVWQRAMSLVEETSRLTANFPKNEEFGLKSQMRRAAVSIPSNIAEGKERDHSREFVRFIHFALGSLSELETQFEVTTRLKILTPTDVQMACDACREIGKMLHGLVNSLRVKY